MGSASRFLDFSYLETTALRLCLSNRTFGPGIGTPSIAVIRSDTLVSSAVDVQLPLVSSQRRTAIHIDLRAISTGQRVLANQLIRIGNQQRTARLPRQPFFKTQSMSMN